MAFLDNSGDILLDAVLTDTGRMRLAKGDGSFRIVKFALGDDEINYELYQKNHSSGSAYYDLDILQTPLLEAFTNNTSMMQSKLMSIPRTNLLYLPMLKLVESGATQRNAAGTGTTGLSGPISRYIIAVDEKTSNGHDQTVEQGAAAGKGIAPTDGTWKGIIDGTNAGTTNGDMSYIMLHQGLNTTEISPSFQLSADLVETQYIVQMDNRLGRLVSTKQQAFGLGGTLSIGTNSSQAAKVSFIDDDNIATYYLSRNTDTGFVVDLSNYNQEDENSIRGPRGTAIAFGVHAQLQLQQSNYLFTKLGKTDQSLQGHVTAEDFTGNYIDSTIRVIGATTGYKVDIPIRYMKKTSDTYP